MANREHALYVRCAQPWLASSGTLLQLLLQCAAHAHNESLLPRHAHAMLPGAVPVTATPWDGICGWTALKHLNSGSSQPGSKHCCFPLGYHSPPWPRISCTSWSSTATSCPPAGHGAQGHISNPHATSDSVQNAHVQISGGHCQAIHTHWQFGSSHWESPLLTASESECLD